ncbi:MAG: 2-oxoglutarate dehydrogenase E1 component, partial [Parachlamydiaceae bacterium]|nr:2-oxoglutarate dehydrogenase E1 component [Parachlamydiaceae bacterium]
MQKEHTPEEFVSSLNYLEEIQKDHLNHQLTLDPTWNSFFRDLEAFSSESLTPSKNLTFSGSEKIEKLIHAYRRYGHQSALINPLDANIPPDFALTFCKESGVNVVDSGEKFPSTGLFNKSEGTFNDFVEALKIIYCRTIGFEFDHIDDVKLKSWIQQQIESGFFLKSLEKKDKLKILHDLTKAEFLESFLHTKHVGKKRFSLEGAESLIPMLTSFVSEAALKGVEEILIGMAHRGRLNVLANVLNKSIQGIFKDFNEEYDPLPEEKMGDIRYHKGHLNESIVTEQGKKIRLFMSPNPSHLESVDPVIEGQTKAKQVLKGNVSSQDQFIPILLHGDAAIAGQGVVYETLQMGKLHGYQTGGTLHLVINNQIGFTTLPKQARSTRYCTDIAKSFGCPIFHVNAEDPEACMKVMLFAFEIRQRFHCDVFIDLNCYRKYGHNEGDEPVFTQPSDYKTIRQKQSIRQLYRNNLIENKIISENEAESIEETIKSDYQNVFVSMQDEGKTEQKLSKDISLTKTLDTGVKGSRLKEIAEKFSTIPSEFHLHPKVQQLVSDRKKAVLEDKEIDWGLSEFLAYGTLVSEGIPVRISGQDCGRGTFSHRHALWVDQENGKEYFPLSHLDEKQGRFEVFNSHLSEMGVLGFEYGYSTVLINGLTIWEAQFGDFVNSAQVIIDQYIASGEQKWDQASSLVLFLPHGFEGQG